MSSHLETKRRIQAAKDAYYRDGTSDLTDEEYDALEEELRLVEPDSELLKQIGSDANSGWTKDKHEIPMGSLNKAKTEEEYNAWLKTVGLNVGEFGVGILMISEKLDGISIAIQYSNGIFVRAITRGDGTVGEDITPNVGKMKNVPKNVPLNYTGWLRGEIVLLKEDWKQYFSDKKNPRNAAAGIAKRHDGKECEHLTVLYYNAEGAFNTRYEEFEFIKIMLRLKTACFIGPFLPNEIPNVIKSWENNREEIPYEIDGMVVEINVCSMFNGMGRVDNRPKGAIAYKFPPEHKETTVTGVTWQVGRTGRITPVAELEPVDIGGVTISRASLHTARMALNLQAGPGSRVIISRRNDVIPYVEKVLSPPTSPITEPTSLGEIEWDGEYLVVKKMDDKTELYNSLKVWVDKLRILHWGSAFIRLLMDYDLIKSLPDIYRLDWTMVASFAGDGVAKRARKSLESKGVEMDLASFISALNIRHCDSTAKLIVGAGVDTIDKFLDYGCAAHWLVDVDGIGKVKAAAIEKSVNLLAPTILNLKTYIKIKERGGHLIGKSFCFTGSMTRPRKELENMALNAGAEIRKSVAAGLTYLVIADPTSTTVKARKARELGTKCIGEDEFKELCGK